MGLGIRIGMSFGGSLFVLPQQYVFYILKMMIFFQHFVTLNISPNWSLSHNSQVFVLFFTKTSSYLLSFISSPTIYIALCYYWPLFPSPS